MNKPSDFIPLAPSGRPENAVAPRLPKLSRKEEACLVMNAEENTLQTRTVFDLQQAYSANRVLASPPAFPNLLPFSSQSRESIQTALYNLTPCPTAFKRQYFSEGGCDEQSCGRSFHSFSLSFSVVPVPSCVFPFL